MDKPTAEVKAGSTVTYTIALKNAQNRTVAAARDLQLQIETPSGPKNATLRAGQSSTTFTWQASNSGVAHIMVRSGKLYPATGLVLITPSSKIAIEPIAQPAQAIARREAEEPAKQRTGLPREVIARRPTASGGGGQPAPQAAPPPPPPPPASARPSKIQLYVEPLPVYGSAVDHVWKANVSVAALGDNGSLMPVTADVPVHLSASSGHLSTADIVLSAGKVSDFDNPVVLTANRSGTDSVAAVSSLGPAGPVDVEYLQPPPAQLRLSVGAPVLGGNGSSTASVQVCVLDEAGAITSSKQDMQVTLTATTLSTSVPIHADTSCSNPIPWTSGAGSVNIVAEAEGGLKDSTTVTFPSFPWYFVWLAVTGGLLGAAVGSSGDLFSPRWWSHAWRALVIGGLLGALFYLFARFGAIALPKDSPVNIQNIPVVSGVGSFLLGFLGGLYGKKLWQGKQDETQPPSPPQPPKAQAAGASPEC